MCGEGRRREESGGDKGSKVILAMDTQLCEEANHVAAGNGSIWWMVQLRDIQKRYEISREGIGKGHSTSCFDNIESWYFGTLQTL